MAFDILEEAAKAASFEEHVPYVAPVVPGLSLHIDGDYLAYYAAGDDDTLPDEAKERANTLIHLYKAAAGADSIIMHTTHKASTKGERFLVATVKAYQDQRVGSRKPKNHGVLQAYLQEYNGPLFKPKVWTTREADDGIAYLAQYWAEQPLGYCAIATADKDMRMLPGLHVRWKERDTVRVMPGEFCKEVVQRHLKNDEAVDSIKVYGTKWFWLQMLHGDTADNIPGLESYKDVNGKVKKVGEVTAGKLLADIDNDEDAFWRVMHHYYNFYGAKWADRFVEQAVLLWLRRDHVADIADFAGFLKIANTEVWDALDRLKKRIEIARTAINQIAS